MIVITGEIIVEEGTVDRVRAALVEMQNETRKEKGCLAYSFAIDVGDANRLVLSERWESMEALQAHFVSPHMAAFGAAVAEAKPVGMEIKAFDIAGKVDLPM